MLEFIVLGQIPGTGLVITFSWAVVIATIVIGGGLLHYVRKGRSGAHLVSIEEQTI